jgi:hypothetical protein
MIAVRTEMKIKDGSYQYWFRVYRTENGRKCLDKIIYQSPKIYAHRQDMNEAFREMIPLGERRNMRSEEIKL